MRVFSALAAALAAVIGCKVLAVDAQRWRLNALEKNLRLNYCAGRVSVQWALIGGSTGLLSDDFLKIDVEGV